MRHPGIGGGYCVGWRRILVCQSVARDLEELSFVMEFDSFAWVGKENPISIRTLRLENLDGVVLLGCTIRTGRFIRAIESIDFLSKNRAAKSAAGFPHFFA